MSELRRRILAGRRGRDRELAARKYVHEACGGVFDPETLQELADGPIMDPLRIYLPDGKITKAQFEERERKNKRGPR